MATSGNARIVQDFYRLVNERSQEGIGEYADTFLAPDVVLSIPPTLPYGGLYQGRDTLRAMFTSSVATPEPSGPTNLVVRDIIDDGPNVVALTEFDWFAPGTSDCISSGALELFRFDDGKIVEIRAFYWDTAACAELLSRSARS